MIKVLGEKSTLLVSKQAFDEMEKFICCMEIAEGKSIPGTLHHLRKEYIITGSLGTGRGGYEAFFGCEVVDLNRYIRPLKPLTYSDHYDDVHEGNRERAYTGMLIKYGLRLLVCLDQVYFQVSHDIKQLALF